MLTSIRNAASKWEVSPWTVRAWARDGLIKTVKLGSRRLVPESEIERVAKEGLDTSQTAESDSRTIE